MKTDKLEHPTPLCSLTEMMYSLVGIQRKLGNGELEGRTSEAEMDVGSAYVVNSSRGTSSRNTGLLMYTTVNWKYGDEEIMFLFESKPDNPLASKRAFGGSIEDFSPTSSSLIVYPISSQEGQDLQFCFRTNMVTNYKPVYGCEMTIEGEPEFAMDEIVGSKRGDRVLDLCLAEVKVDEGPSNAYQLFRINQAGNAYKADTKFGFIKCEEFGAPGTRLGDERPENLQLYAKMVSRLCDKLIASAPVKRPSVEEPVVEEVKPPSYLEKVFLD